MIDGMQLVVPALEVGAAFLLGFVSGRRRRRAGAPAQPRPVCPCGHAIGFHEERDGKCHGEEEQRRFTGPASFRDVMVPCTCLHYSGPELISSFTLREISHRPTTDTGE